MTKDEMKDKISMALKDPVRQQGFEKQKIRIRK